MYLITLCIICILLVLVVPSLIGEKNSELSKGDERQKTIFKEASNGSWYVIVLYLLVNVVSGFFTEEKFNLHNGYLDTFIVGLFGYIVFYFLNTKRAS